MTVYPKDTAKLLLLAKAMGGGGGSSVSVEALSVTENGVYTAPEGKAYTPVTVNVSGGGGTAQPMRDVNFFDYDGTVVASYTAADFAGMTAMPDNPSHDGLVAQGWNWNLAEAKSYVAEYGKLNVGQMYITDDGATRLYIRIAAEGRMTLPLYFSQTVANGVTIDWGDGSATESVAGTGNLNTSHTYSAVGDYVISLLPDEGCTLGLGNGTTTTSVFGGGNNGRVYQNMLQRVEIGTGVTSIGGYAFDSCYSIVFITIPDSVMSIGGYAFQGCYSLVSVTVPSGVTNLQNYLFSNCGSLASVAIPSSVTSIAESFLYFCYAIHSVTIPSNVTSITGFTFYQCRSISSVKIPSGVTSIEKAIFNGCSSLNSVVLSSDTTSIGEQAFINCYSLASITIPGAVTSIGSQVFRYCYGMKEYHLLPTTPPTLGANVFQGIPSDCIIYVPKGSLEAYQTATNWSTYASYMQEEP